MKQIVLCMLFLFSIVFVCNTVGDNYAPVVEKVQAEDEAVRYFDQTISVLMAANSYADVAAQPTPGFYSNFARRYRPAGFSFDKLLTFLAADASDHAFKTIAGISQEYAARLKNAGYYIFALRKIII